jgi:hypothetical protein
MPSHHIFASKLFVAARWRLTATIAGGDAPDSLVAALRAREREHKTASAELAALTAGPAVRSSRPEIRAAALRLLDEWRGLLGRHVGTSRQMLRKLLNADARFVFYPRSENGERNLAPVNRESVDALTVRAG